MQPAHALVYIEGLERLRRRLVNSDTEGAIESVRINGVSVLSESCYLSQKTPFIKTNIMKEIKEDISILKLNISNLQMQIRHSANQIDENNQKSLMFIFNFR